MIKLATVYPFGLNDKLESRNLILNTYDFHNFHKLNTPYFTFPSKRRNRSHGHRKNSSQQNDPPNISNTIDTIFDLYKTYKLYELYVLFRSLSQTHLNDCLQNIDNYVKDHPHKRSNVVLLLLAYCSRFVLPTKKNNKDDDCVYCPIPFIHSAMEEVGVDGLMKRKEIKELLPLAASECSIRTTFSYGPTIGRKLFNYNKVLNNISTRDLKKLKCDCQKQYADFVYRPHGHVHTGCLDIIDCIPLREIMKKGAKYRLKPRASKQKLILTIENSLLKLRGKLSRKFNVVKEEFGLWFDAIMEKVRFKVKTLSQCQLESNDIFRCKEVVNYLKFLHERFVIVPVDKASNNFAVICKKFYIEVLMKELGFCNGEIVGNAVYKHVTITDTRFFSEQIEANLIHQNTLEVENHRIPLLYWTSKQHKNPYKFRFISGASHSCNETISVEVCVALKCIKNHFKNFCTTIRKRLGISCFWSIDNSVEFVTKLAGIDKATSIKTYDFSTLYTNLPLDYIYNMLKNLIDLMFKNSGVDRILINADRKKAFYYRGSEYLGYKMFYKAELLQALHYILYNTYVQFAGKKFQQTKGIPMGGNASPFIADLCLAWAEYRFMIDLSKSKNPSDFKLAKTLSNNCRYIDDISVINYLGFGELAKRIYHNELLLEESEFSYHYDNFLDLSIRIHSKRFIMGIYHKVDDFNFEVINFPFPDSNIHSRIGYNAFYLQLVRFFRLCNNVNDFCLRVKMLYTKLHKRGYSKSMLSRFFLKFCTRYPVDIMFGAPDGNSLWLSVLQFESSKSCCIYDYEAIAELIKPCSVIVNKLITDTQHNSGDIASDADILNSGPQETDNLPGVSTSCVPSDLGIVHPPLHNPRNHCYINSCLQVILRIFMHYTEDIHFNNNKEGCLTKGLADGIYSDSCGGLSHFKLLLARYDDYFNGINQQDVNECFGLLMDLLHLGTQENLLSDLSLSQQGDDQFVTSLTKRLFLFNIKHRIQCLRCRLITTFYSESRTYFVYPSNNKTISDILCESFTSSMDKTCICCKDISKHEEILTLEHPPEILVLVISRFEFTLTNDKNRSMIEVNEDLTVSSTNYKLIGSIHHHGTSITSGHYTCNVFYPDIAYTCNDSQILPLNGFQFSDSIYMVFYARNVSSTS